MKAVAVVFLVVLLQQNIAQVIQNCQWECKVPGRCDLQSYMEKNIIPRLDAMSEAIDELSKKPRIEIGLIPFGEAYGDVLQPMTDDGAFKFNETDDPKLSLLYPTLNNDTHPSFIRIINDGAIVLGDNGYSRVPTSNSEPTVAGYGEDFTTSGVTNAGSVHIRQQVNGKARKIINDDINRFLRMNGASPSFSSKFLLLVTYNETARFNMHHLRYIFQIAVASDGIRSFAVLIYDKLDENSRYGVGYYDPKCRVLKEVIPKAMSKNLVNTTNCDAKGKHVIALKPYC